MFTTKINGITIKTKESYDFSWLEKLGRVFTVFDEQDSGNISFGIEKDGKKIFAKFAGVRTCDYEGKMEDVVERLKASIKNYIDLKHESLINYIDSYEINNGFLVLFDWFDGECMHSHWLFPPSEKYTNPKSPNFRFKRLPIEKQLKAYEDILCFHRHVEKSGYVAIDFYDGSILYDFNCDVIKICDIDFYEKRPYTNEMGRMWGSTRFMSPEEFTLGAEIDEKTNVYNMGALAFELFGGSTDRAYEKWTLNKSRYDIALKAVSEDKGLRYANIDAFYTSWMNV